MESTLKFKAKEWFPLPNVSNFASVNFPAAAALDLFDAARVAKSESCLDNLKIVQAKPT